MGNIIDDIVEDIEIKPNKIKKVLKWVFSIAVGLIGIAFVLGQFKSSFFNRMDSFEINLNELKKEQTNGFNSMNARIDKAYDDGTLILNEFKQNNNKKLELIIDYGSSNKDLLKQMLEINSLNLESQIEKAKNKNIKSSYVKEPEKEFSIAVTSMKDKPYYNKVQFIDVKDNDTIFNITGATQEYINNIDRKKYEVGTVIDSDKYPKRYDFSYHNK